MQKKKTKTTTENGAGRAVFAITTRATLAALPTSFQPGTWPVPRGPHKTKVVL